MIQQTNKQGKVEVNNTGLKMTTNNTHLLSFFYSIGLTVLASLLFLFYLEGLKNLQNQLLAEYK
jgi:heme/copper-type cytochrome/quinol oxidase subunit 4